MTIKAHACGRLFRRAHRDQQFKLESLFDLGARHDLGGATEEWVACWRNTGPQAEARGDLLTLLYPTITEIAGLLRGTDADVFAHSETLQPVDVSRRLVTKAVACDVKNETLDWNATARGGQGINVV